ncbi:MAG: uroporphyrinogen decarboxylase family protein [Opitutaceae bacterium]
MNGRERILTTIRHEEPDRVPVSPRIWAWLRSEHGDDSLATHLRACPDMDPMFIIPQGTPNYLDSCPDAYDLPGVSVDQSKSMEGELTVIERTFRTPAGVLSDRTLVPPAGGKFGVSPNPFRTEHLVKSRADLPALRYLLPPINRNFDHLDQARKEIGDRGVIMVTINSPLDYHAGCARDMQDLMMDYYDDRSLFDELFRLFRQRCLEQIRATLEGGAEFIFGTWFFNSLSSGWSPAIFEEVFVPQIREQVELTHELGGFYDYYDDGRLKDSMEMIASTGIDILETCTPPPTGDFPLASAKQSIGGRTTIKGYVDLLHVVKDGSPALIERTVRQAMEIGKPGGGFIIGSSDSFREGTPRENVEAYFRACLRYGVY